MKISCAACKAEVEFLEKVGVRDTCPSCDAWLHSCVNCGFLVNGQCTEPSAESVRDLEGMNFCDWYRPGTQNTPRQGSGQAERRTQEDKGRGEAEEMWKKLTKK